MNLSGITQEKVERAISIARALTGVRSPNDVGSQFSINQIKDQIKDQKNQNRIETSTDTLGDPGLAPHMVIEDLIGLTAYRQFMQCPDTEALASYAEDSPHISLDRAISIAHHETRCPVCAADIADLRLTLRQQVAQALDSLPEWNTRLVGHGQLRSNLCDSLASGDETLLTLVAPSGMGKTRLMLETVLEQSYLFPDGVWLLPNAGIDTPSGIAATLGEMMQLSLSPRQSAFEQVCDYLRNKRAVIAFDSITSQQSGIRTALESFNHRAPGLVCIGTSTEDIGLPDEQRVAIPPLDYVSIPTLTSVGNKPSTEALLTTESFEMFSASAEQIVPNWHLYLQDETQMRATATVCAYSAGNPLALELASTWLTKMSPAEIARSLANLPVIRSESPTNRPSLQSIPTSLQMLLGWSINLLPARQAHLLHGLSPFQDWFTAEQARTVAAEEQAKEMLEELRSHALLQRWQTGGRTFYRLLEPVAQYVSARIPGAMRSTIDRRFVAYFGTLAQDLAARLETRHQIEAMQETETSLSHLRQAMTIAFDNGETRVAGQIALSMSGFLNLRGRWEECQEQLRLSLDGLLSAEADTLAHHTRLALARSLMKQGKLNEAIGFLNTALTGFQNMENQVGITNVQRSLATLAQFQDNHLEARSLYQTALKGYQNAGDAIGAADCRYALGMIAQEEGNYAEADLYLTASLSIFRDFGDRYRLGNVLNVLGNLAVKQKRLEAAREYYEESLRVRTELGDVRGVASVTAGLGKLWHHLKDYTRAEYCFSRAVRSLQRINDKRTLAAVHRNYAMMAYDNSDYGTARLHYQSALQLFMRLGQHQEAAFVQNELARIAGIPLAPNEHP